MHFWSRNSGLEDICVLSELNKYEQEQIYKIHSSSAWSIKEKTCEQA